MFRFWIFNTSRFREWGNACNLCYATSSTNNDVACDVTCVALWRWIHFFLSVRPDDYRSCRLIQVFCLKYCFVFFYIIVIRLEAWLTNWLTVNLLKKYKTKKQCTFLANTKYISSRELKTSKFSCYALMKILMFLTHSMKYIWYSTQKSKYPLCLWKSNHLTNDNNDLPTF